MRAPTNGMIPAQPMIAAWDSARSRDMKSPLPPKAIVATRCRIPTPTK